MKTKYRVAKLTLIGAAIVATPSIAAGLMWRANTHSASPRAVAVAALSQGEQQAEEEAPVNIRIIVIRSAGTTEDE